MIINLPSKNDYELSAKDNLTQSFNLLFKVFTEYEQLLEDDPDSVSLTEIWQYNTGIIKTSLILLYTSIEELMKATICEISPLLLVDKPKNQWPTLPDSKDEDFSNLFTIGGESLLHTFCAIGTTQILIDKKLIDLIEEIRKKRNVAIHGANITSILPEYLLTCILNIFTTWFGKDSLLKELRKNIEKNPLFGYHGYEFADADLTNSIKYLDFIENMIGIKKMSIFFSTDIEGRRYFCPSCLERTKELEWIETKWAFLSPNKPDSTSIKCLNCNDSFNIQRADCHYEECKGNVLYDDSKNFDELVCLTCIEVYHQ